MIEKTLIFTAIAVVLGSFAGGCAATQRNSSEAAWRRGQCEQVVDPKSREKCLEQVEREFGR